MKSVVLAISGSPHRHFSFIPGLFRWEVFPSPVTLVRCPVPPFWDPPVGGVASWNRSSLTSPVTLVGLCCFPCSERSLVGDLRLFFTTYMCLVDPCREQCFLNKNTSCQLITRSPLYFVISAAWPRAQRYATTTKRLLDTNLWNYWWRHGNHVSCMACFGTHFCNTTTQYP